MKLIEMAMYGLGVIVCWEIGKPIVDALARHTRERRERAIMWCLKHAPEGLRGLELCEVTGISRSAIYVYLARLEDKGLIRMEFEGVDYPRRSRYYAVTP